MADKKIAHLKAFFKKKSNAPILLGSGVHIQHNKMPADGIPTEDHLPSQERILEIREGPIEKHPALLAYLEKIPPMTTHPILEVDKWHGRHQTLIVVEVKDDPPSEFVNRSTRLCTSLNLNDTMKADIMSLSDGTYYRNLVYTGVQPGGISKAGILAQAKKWGYNQCIIVSYCGSF